VKIDEPVVLGELKPLNLEVAEKKEEEKSTGIDSILSKYLC
jgi:hypothetical protein